jgi:hypothetical protein
LGATELIKKLKEHFKVEMPYMRVYYGKNLAMDKLYGPWNKSFDILYRFKAQIESESLGSVVVIDNHIVGNKLRFIYPHCSDRAFRFVVNLKERTYACRKWQGTGIPCRHAIAYITSIPSAKLEDYVDDCYSVERFRAAYEGVIPSIPDKTMWPKATHGFFMHPPLLKSTVGRSKNRHKGALEGGSRKKIKRHECPICHQLGHHWYTYKNGDPAT